LQAKIMKVAVFSTKSYDRTFLEAANVDQQHELVFFEPRLNLETSVLTAGFPAACVFVNDQLDAKTLFAIAEKGIRLLALRSAGFNHVDLAAARDLDLTLLRVPAYSPFSVAEHAVAMMLSLNRKIHSCLQPRPRRQFRPRWAVGFRPPRENGRDSGYGQNRRRYCQNSARIRVSPAGIRCLPKP
jgi:lactate dehydrogenase-like 2-hydroxyacid dehydrogenase